MPLEIQTYFLYYIFFSVSEPLPPQNLSLAHVSSRSARVTWDRHPRSIPDGFVVNVTRGLTTRSRYLPDGTLSMYTIRELNPGQHYRLALTAVRNTGHEQIHSVAQHLAFTTSESPEPGEISTVGYSYSHIIVSYICLEFILFFYKQKAWIFMQLFF